MRRKRKPSCLKDVATNLNSYLQETTIHGFRYLSDYKNTFEFLFWILSIAAGFYVTAYMVLQSVNENYENPILTTVDTTSVKHVPFPAITVDAGGILDPWGYTVKSMNLLAFECYDDPFTCEKPAELRKNFTFFLYSLVGNVKTLLEEEHKSTTAEEFNRLKNQFGMARDFRELSDAVAYMAFLEAKDKKSAKNVYRSLRYATANTLASFSVRSRNSKKEYGTKIFLPLILEAAEAANITEDDISDCKRRISSDNCPSTIASAYLQVLLPFIVNKVPYGGLGFGDLLAFFARRVLTSSPLFLNRGKLSRGEEPLLKYMTEVMNKIVGKDLGISTFEVSKLVDKVYKNTHYQVPYIMNQDQYKMQEFNVYYDVWRNYMSGRKALKVKLEEKLANPPCLNNDTILEVLGISGPCKLANLLSNNLEAILPVMKYSMQPPHFTESKEEFWSSFENAKSLLGFNVLEDFEGNFSTIKPSYNLNPRIFLCNYNKENAEPSPTNCKLFHRSYTTEGFGYSFNNGNFFKRHRDNVYNNIFYKRMYPNADRTQKSDYVYPETSGPAYGLNMVLKLNDYMNVLEKSGNRGSSLIKSRVFKVAIHDPAMPADLRSGGIEIEPGYLSTFLITPSQQLTLDPVKELEENRRNCKFRSENEGLKIFNEYTQTGCIFECQITHGLDKCGCIPWNYPHLGDPSPVCDYMGAYCFEEVMAETEIIQNCDCPFDCDTTRYSYSVSSTKLDTDMICKKAISETFDYYASPIYARPAKFMRNYEQTENSEKDTGDDAICKENVRNIAVAQFQLAGQIVTQIKRDIRVTFADNVSNFGTGQMLNFCCSLANATVFSGGTIGLFTGMSILSIFEVFFWIIRILAGTKVTNEDDKKEKDKVGESGQIAQKQSGTTHYYNTWYRK